jgi:hypothetical protein
MATALALSWRNFSDAIDVANPVEKIGRFSPGIGYDGFMGLFSFMLISIPRAISVSIPKISGNPISWSATTYRIAVVGVLPKSAEVNKGTCFPKDRENAPCYWVGKFDVWALYGQQHALCALHDRFTYE